MQIFCPLLNDTQICWTKPWCRNSALRSMTLKSAEPNNDAEILHLGQWHSNLLIQQRCRNSALCSMTLKSAEPNNDAEILQLVQCVIDNICKFTSNDAEILHLVQLLNTLLCNFSERKRSDLKTFGCKKIATEHIS